jgi:transposase-like protein
MEAAGRGGGQVKRRAYLRFVLEVREEESLADQRGLKIVHKTIDQIRQEFEKERGEVEVVF